MKRQTWRDKPKIIKKIQNEENRYILFIDESGEGNKKALRRAFENKKLQNNFDPRNDLFILNGVAISGAGYYILEKKLKKLKKKITPDGQFNYNKKGILPINLRNHDIVAKNPPFNNPTTAFYNNINKVIATTNYVQICSGVNYYTYTYRNDENEKTSPLLMNLGILLINYAEYLNTISCTGIIVFEEETKKHDTMKLAYIKKVLKHGTRSFKNDYFKNITAVYFRKKWTEENSGAFVTTAGIELADLTISAIRRTLHPEYQVIERKFFNYPNYIQKGLTSIR
jgi:hypothetical protein